MLWLRMRGVIHPFPLNLLLSGDVFVYGQGQLYNHFAQTVTVCGEEGTILA